MKAILFIIVALTVVYCQEFMPTGLLSDPLEEHKIDLSLEPRDRFKAVTKRYKNEILPVLNIYSEAINSAIRYMFKIIEMVTIDTENERY